MEQKKVYLLLKVTVSPKVFWEFNEYWGKVSLPFWHKHGVRHVGSFSFHAGGPTNEVLRLFEFKNISHFDEFEDILRYSEEGKKLRADLSRFDITVERKLLRDVFE